MSIKQLLPIVGLLVVGCLNPEARVPEVNPLVVGSAVRIAAYPESKVGVSLGSGFIYRIQSKEDGGYFAYVLTAFHVIEIAGLTGAEYFIHHTTETGDARLHANAIKAELLGYDKKLDVAVLKFSTNRWVPAAGLSSKAPEVGSKALLLSHPIGLGLVITEGYVGFTDGQIRNITCDAYPGSSGGPVFDMNTNKVIGLLVQIANYYDGLGNVSRVSYIAYMIPMNLILPWLKDKAFT